MGGPLTLLLPAGVALATAVVALALDGWASRRAAAIAAGSGMAVAAALAAAGVPTAVHAVAGIFAAGGAFSAMLATVFAAAALALLGGVDELSAHPRGGVLAALGAIAALGAGLAPASFDFVALLLALETASLAAYAIVALGRHDGAPEAAIKYFVQGSVATSLLLAGVAVAVGGVAGGSTFSGFLAVTGAQRSGSLGLASLGVLLLTVGVAFKAGAFPFHSWVPDAYETAPASGAGVLAGSVKAGALLTLLVVTSLLGASSSTSVAPVAAISVGSIVLGNLAALRQRSLARMLAYSGIAQAGYALVPIVAAHGSGIAGALGTSSAAFFVATYAVAAAGSFAAVSAFGALEPEWDGSIAKLSGAGARHPMLSASLGVLLLSLTGVPPLVGFFGKLYAFKAAIVAGWWPLALAGFLGSVVSFGYYGGVLKSLYFDDSESAQSDIAEQPAQRARWATFAVATAAVIVVAAGVAVLVGGEALTLVVFGVR